MSTVATKPSKSLNSNQRDWLKRMGEALEVSLKSDGASDARPSGDSPQSKWEENQDAMEETDGLVKEMEESEIPKAALFRKGIDLIRNLAKQKKFAEANKAYDELEPKIHAEYEKLEKARGSGVRDLGENDSKEGTEEEGKKAAAEDGKPSGKDKGGASPPADDAKAAEYKKQVLKVGSKGPAVEYLQNALKASCPSIAVDGKFGPGTQKAVKDFQTSKQLKPDGIVGEKTWTALGGGAAAAPAAPGAAKAASPTDTKAAPTADKSAEGVEGRPTGSTKEAPAKAPGGFISASVGKGGKNLPDDVKAVQQGLNTYTGTKLNEDGKFNAQTQKAIEEFQKRLGQFKPDGLLQPGRGPIRVLSGDAKMPPPPEEPKPIAPPELGEATLDKGAFVWNSTREILETNIKELKKGVLSAYGTEHRVLLKQIDDGLGTLESVMDKLDTRLADSLDAAYKAAGAARIAELKKSQAIMTEYIKYLKTESLIKHMDDNPFGVKTNLQKVITNALTHLSKLLNK